MPILIHISRNGQKEGPYTTGQIQQMLADGSIARYTLAWKEGLSQWVPLSQILDSPPPQPSHIAPPPVTIAPVATIQHSGIGRLAYFGILIGITFLTAILQAAVASEPSAAGVVTLLSVAVCFVPVVLRLQNIGKSGWWSLLCLVPIANLYIGVLCLFAPAGYERSKKLDTPAKVILSIIIGFIALMVLIAIIAAFS
jgi:uncharacterized membrane protein YhaH (DUF805 family)